MEPLHDDNHAPLSFVIDTSGERTLKGVDSCLTLGFRLGDFGIMGVVDNYAVVDEYAICEKIPIARNLDVIHIFIFSRSVY